MIGVKKNIIVVAVKQFQFATINPVIIKNLENMRRKRDVFH